MSGRDVLYAHLSEDGGIFIVDGASGRQAWVTQRRLREELRGSSVVVYSRDHPDRDPPPIVRDSFSAIADSGLDVRISREAHPDTARPCGATTLILAASSGDLDLVVDLLARGADVDGRDDDQRTALMYACRAGDSASSLALINAGADVNAADSSGATPLMYAAESGARSLVELLLASGARIGDREQHGYRAFDLADLGGHKDVAELLAAG